MPITTFRCGESTFINDVDIKRHQPDNFFVERIVFKRLFRKPIIVYQLLYCLESGEYQIINFPPVENGGSSINTWVSKQVILTYLIARKEK